MMTLESEALQEELESLTDTLSIKEAALFLRVTPMTIYRLIYAGRLIASKNGGASDWTIKKESVIKYASANETIAN